MLAFLRGSTYPPRAALSAARARKSLVLLVRSLGRALQYQLRHTPADRAGLLHFISAPVMAMVRVCSARFHSLGLLLLREVRPARKAQCNVPGFGPYVHPSSGRNDKLMRVTMASQDRFSSCGY